MPNYRRAYIPGGTFFFSIVTYARRPIFSDSKARKILGNVFREAIAKWPMTVNAIVLLPEHLHMICSLPSGDGEYSKRIGWIKKEFTKRWLTAGGRDAVVSSSTRIIHEAWASESVPTVNRDSDAIKRSLWLSPTE